MAYSLPLVVVIAGPNGAGTTTAASRLLRGAPAVSEFVNSDTIAQGLSAFRPEQAAVASARHMLQRLPALARRPETFAFETTLAEGVRFERRIFHSLFATLDQKEGMHAFIEKRAAKFENR